MKNILNPKGHQNCISGAKVAAILLKVWILPFGGSSAVEGMQSMGLPCLVLYRFWIISWTLSSIDVVDVSVFIIFCFLKYTMLQLWV